MAAAAAPNADGHAYRSTGRCPLAAAPVAGLFDVQLAFLVPPQHGRVLDANHPFPLGRLESFEDLFCVALCLEGSHKQLDRYVSHFPLL
jgi:hypothetical protein